MKYWPKTYSIRIRKYLKLYNKIVNNNILVTGGGGYIGSHTCIALKESGFTPVVFDNLSTGHKDFVKWGPLVVGDLKSKEDIARVFREFDIKHVIHIAGKSYVDESVQNPIKYYEENINGTTNLLAQFIKSHGKTFIFSSSCSIYGDKPEGKIIETDAQNPINPYGFTKLASEKLIKYLSKSHSFNFSILRYFNVAGADKNLEVGEMHDNETHVIPLMIRAFLRKEIFKIYGRDFQTHDGTPIRDYIHVTDLARAHVLAFNRNNLDRKSLVCNLGSGIGYSVLQLVNEIKRFDPNFRFEFGDKRAGDPPILVADISQSRKILGWQPLNSDISTIINSAVAWQSKIS
jgi:UDP-glucose-4-epimerase GalE